MALVSHIFYGLDAWTSKSYTAGQRVQNAGNAYQALTGGTGTVAPTGTGSNINGGGGVTWKYLAPVNYTDIQTWADNIPATLTQPVVGYLWNTGQPVPVPAGATYFTLQGHTTSSSNTITLTVAAGESFADYLKSNPTQPLQFNGSYGVGFQLSASGFGGVNYFNIQDDNVIISRIQFQDPNASSGCTIVNSFANCTLSQCLFDGYPQGGGASILDLGTNGSGTTKIINSIVIDRSPNQTANTWVAVNVYNTLVISGVTTLGVNSPAGTLAFLNQGTAMSTTMVDSAVFGYAAGQTVGSNNTGSTTVTNSMFTSASITGSNLTTTGCIFSKTAASQLVSASGSLNLRLAAASNAINAGVTDTTNNPQKIDILGTSRPQGSAWDIGAYEVPAAAGAGSVAGTSTATATGRQAVVGTGSVTGVATATATGSSTAGIGSVAATATASAVGRSASLAAGSANGVASVAGYNAAGSIAGVVTIDPIPPHSTNIPFTVTGTYTIYPALSYVDDDGTNYTPIPMTGLSPLGVQQFSFNHPGVDTPGMYQLVITDTVSGAVGTATFNITAAPIRLATAAIAKFFPPSGPPGLTKIIPAYLFEQYADDDNLQALFAAYNKVAQSYLDWFNETNLPIYTKLNGPLLDWVAQGLYGMQRPNLTTATSSAIGPFNTYDYDTLAMATSVGTGTTTVYNITDDLFKRFITWNFYKGDGFTFNVPWLKRRVMRFLGGVNGVDYGVTETYQVSVQFSGTTVINITISAGSQPTTYVPILNAAIGSGVCQLPFQYSYNILQS